MKTLIKNGTLAVLTDKAAFFFADGKTIEKQVPLSNYKFEGWSDGADFDAAIFETAHSAFVEKNNVTKAKREAQKAEREAEKAARHALYQKEAEELRADRAAQELDREIIVFYADAQHFTSDCNEVKCFFDEDFSSCKEDAQEFLSECPQGWGATADMYKITCSPANLPAFLDEFSFVKEEEYLADFFIRVLSRETSRDSDFLYRYFAVEKIETVDYEHESIEDRLIISYQHETYMNYSHRITGLRFGGWNETTADLSDNPDNVNKTWDRLTDITKADLEVLPLDEAEELIRAEITDLKYDGFRKPSLRSVIQSSGIAQFFAADEEE